VLSKLTTLNKCGTRGAILLVLVFVLLSSSVFALNVVVNPPTGTTYTNNMIDMNSSIYWQGFTPDSYAAAYINSSFDQALTDGLYAPITTSSNNTWNQSRADGLYAPLSSAYNKSFNQSLTDGLYKTNMSWNQSLADGLYLTNFTWNQSLGDDLYAAKKWG